MKRIITIASRYHTREQYQGLLAAFVVTYNIKEYLEKLIEEMWAWHDQIFQATPAKVQELAQHFTNWLRSLCSRNNVVSPIPQQTDREASVGDEQRML